MILLTSTPHYVQHLSTIIFCVLMVFLCDTDREHAERYHAFVYSYILHGFHITIPVSVKQCLWILILVANMGWANTASSRAKTQSFQENRHFIFRVLVTLTPLVSLTIHFIACSAEISVAYGGRLVSKLCIPHR